MLESLYSFFASMQLGYFDAFGLIFGIWCVVLLIRENIFTWPIGIAYVLVSLVIFYEAKLYADFILHIFFLIMNIYGWYNWAYGKRRNEVELPVTHSSLPQILVLLILSGIGIFTSGQLLSHFTDADLPYWDSTTSMLSIAGMWLSAKKKLENWYFWLVVDVLASGIYFYKGIFFYGVLYFFYIGMAIAGYLTWKRSMHTVRY